MGSITMTPQPQHLCREQHLQLAPTAFPALSCDSCHPRETRCLSSWILDLNPQQKHPVSISSTLQLAWALVLAAYTDCHDVVFGLVQEPADPAASVCPVHVKIQPDLAVDKALALLDKHNQLPSHHQLNPEIAGRFPNALAIHHGPNEVTAKLSEGSSQVHPLLVTGEVLDKGLHIHMQYDPEVISPAMGQTVLDQLVHVVDGIRSNPTDTLESLLGIGPMGLKQLQLWNSRLQLHGKESCIHDVIAEKCQQHPSAPAICAWDGSLTYSEVDAKSTQLADCLTAFSPEPEKFVGLLFQKSMWTAVSMLGVMKSGNAFVLLDPSLPGQRLKTLCGISRAMIILTQPEQFSRAQQLGPPVMITHEECRVPSPRSSTLPEVKPYHAAYAAFTSGSSGEPKGVVVDHRAVCSGVDAYCSSLGLDSQSRVFQFASYSFAISAIDHLITLMQGACLCIPSISQLQGSLLDTMLTLDVNWVTITPSVARVLKPESIPGLKTLCLAGESLTRSDLEKWRGHVDLKSVYGQSENTLAALVDTKTTLSHPCDLGYAFAAQCWVVDSRNPHRLVPIGAEGELLLEAPTMARGYLNNEEQTKATFLHNPAWLQDVRPGGHGIFLKTGDIVRVQSDNGSIQYVGRSGTQVKLRGQRIELAEVEFQLRRQFPAADAVVAEIVTPDEERPDGSILVAFIAGKHHKGHSENHHGSPFADEVPSFSEGSRQAVSQMREVLPEYMVPTAFIPLVTLPLTPSGKLNRRLLRNKASELGDGLQRYYVFSGNAHPRRQARTEQESTIQRICSRILRVDSTDIDMNGSFLENGGNSITAMQLVSESREDGFFFTTRDVFRQLSLAELADMVESPKCNGKDDGPAAGEAWAAALKSKLEHQPSAFSSENIADVFPCTETQQWMLNNGEGGDFLLRFKGPLDTGRLQSACQHLVRIHTALRSVFVRVDETLLQVVLKEFDPPFTVQQNIQGKDPIDFARELCSLSGENLFPLGDPPLQFTLIRGGGEEHVLIMRLSHAQYDRICQHTIISDLCAVYQKPEGASSVPTTDFALYVRQIALQQTQEAFAFWRNLLSDSTITKLQYAVPQTETKETVLECSTNITTPRPPIGITMASMIKAAWSTVLREVTDTSDLVFGQLVNMRGIDMPGIYRLVGPCYSILPIRLNHHPSWTILDLLRAVQDQHAQSMPFETAQWDRIVSESTNWPSGTRPQTLVIHQDYPTELDIQMDKTGECDRLRCQLAEYLPNEPADMSVDLYSEPRGDRLSLTLLSSNRFIAKDQLQMLLERLCDTLTRFATAPEGVLGVVNDGK